MATRNAWSWSRGKPVVWGRRVPIWVRLLMGAGAYILALIVQFFMLGSATFWAGWALALVAAGITFGASNKRPGADETYSIRNWGPAPWQVIPGTVLLVIWSILVLTPREAKPTYEDGGITPSLTPNGYEPSASVWFFFAVVAVAWVGFATWMWVKYVRPAFNFRLRDRSAEEAKRDAVSPALLREAGLGVKSEYSREYRFPAIMSRFLDSAGRPTFDMQLIAGQQTLDSVKRSAERIASAWRVPRVTVGMVDAARHIVRVTAVMQERVIPDEVLWEPVNANRPVYDYLHDLPLGVYTDSGETFALDTFGEKNVLAAGDPGSGKSSLANTMVAHAAMHPHVRLAYLDFKQGGEAAAWVGRADVVIDNDVDGASGDEDAAEELRLETATAFLEDVLRDVQRRASRIKKAGRKNVFEYGPNGEPPLLGPDFPFKIVVIDECSILFGGDQKNQQQARACEAVKKIVQLSRSGGTILIMAAQQPTGEMLPPTAKRMISIRSCFFTNDGMSVVASLGKFPEDPALDPSNITRRGEATVLGGARTGRVQMRYVNVEATRWIVQNTRGYRHGFLDDDRRGTEQRAWQLTLETLSPDPAITPAYQEVAEWWKSNYQAPTQQAPASQPPTQPAPKPETPPRPQSRPVPPMPETEPQEQPRAARPASAEPEAVKEWNEPPRNPWL